VYKKHPNQNGVSGGKTRYRFDCHIKNERFRKQITCYKSDVRKLYWEWEKDCYYTVQKRLEHNYPFFEIYDWYLEHYLKYHCVGDSSRPAYVVRVKAKERLNLFFGNMIVKEIKRYHIEDFIIWRREYSPSQYVSRVTNATINRDISILSHFFYYCIDREYYCHQNPAQRMKLKEDNHRRIKLTENQFQELFEKAEKKGHLYTAVLLAVFTGLRREEIFTLSWNDIDFDEYIIRISSKNAKGGKGRIVQAPDVLINHLRELRKKEPDTRDVFEYWNSREGLKTSWRRFKEELSFKNIEDIESGKQLQLCFHDLRHVYAVSLLEAGVSISDIKSLLGHSSVRMTEQRYANVSKTVSRDTANKISNIIPLHKKAI